MLKIDSDEIKSQFKKYAVDFAGRIMPPNNLADWIKANTDDSSVGRQKWSSFQNIWKFYSTPTQKARILDLGCGTGSVVFNALEDKYLTIGMEPEPELINIISKKNNHYFKTSQLKHKYPLFMRAVGEKLPVKSNSFDAIFTYQALEHVNDLKAVLREGVRVLKPGGLMHITAPNYLSFYEGHYCLFWLPLLPKSLAKAYLFFRKRDTKYIDTITYTTKKRIVNCFNKREVAIFDHNLLRFYQQFDLNIKNTSGIKSPLRGFFYRMAKSRRFSCYLEAFEKKRLLILNPQLDIVVIKQPYQQKENRSEKVRIY